MKWTDKVRAGILDVIAGRIVDYRFFVEVREPPRKNLICLGIHIAPDDGGAIVDKRFGTAWADEVQIIDEDAKVLAPTVEGAVPVLGGTTLVLLESLEDAGFPMSRLRDPVVERVIDLRPIIGTRVCIVKRQWEEENKQPPPYCWTGSSKVKKVQTVIAAVLELPATAP